jgi:hypothetical protein
MTAGDVRKKFTIFNEYSYKCFHSAFANTKKSMATELEARQKQTGRGGKEGNIKAYSNLDDDDDDDDETYRNLSRLSIDEVDEDDLTFDTRTQDNGRTNNSYYHYAGGAAGNKSVTFDGGASRRADGAGGKSFRGAAGGWSPRSPSHEKSGGRGLLTSPRNTRTSAPPPGSSSSPWTSHKIKAHAPTCTLPFFVDYWYDKRTQARASIQVHLPSFNETMLSRITCRVGSNQRELVLLVPITKYLGDPVHFERYVLFGVAESDRAAHKKILEWHPKTAARNLTLAELKSNPTCNVVTMEVRIPIEFKVALDFASVANEDPYFYGHQIFHYPDGSAHLHVELVGECISSGSNTAKTTPVFKVPASVDVVSVSGGGTRTMADSCSYMEITVGEPTAVTTSRSERSATTRRLTSNTSEAGFSGGASVGSNAHQSVKSRKTVAALPPIPAYAGNKRKLTASAQSVV